MKLNRSFWVGAVLGGLALTLTACDPSVVKNPGGRVSSSADRENPIPRTPDGGVVKARAKLNLWLGADGNGKGEILAMAFEPMQPVVPEIEIFAGQSDDTDISVELGVVTTYGLDLASFVASPAISNSVVSFGSIGVGDTFYDNNVKVCGGSGNGQCTTASIRAYTTQAESVLNPGDGLWNADGGYGAPLSIVDTSSVAQTIQLGQENSSLLHSFNLGNKRVLTFADWQALGGAAPSYAISADFTEAGAGIYAATIVLEYVLD